MTLSELRGMKPAPAERAAPAEEHHPGPAEYVKIGALIAITEALEITSFFLGLPQWVLIAVLIPLMIINFGLIALWFMHLKFDSRTFYWLFAGGLLLAASLFIIVLATLGGGLF